MSDVKNLRLASRIIHAGQHTCPTTGAVSTPIYQTSTFAFKDTDEGAARFGGTDPGYKYTRLGNPTVAALEECIAELEGGCGALAASTGMAAVHTVYFTLLGAGAHVVGTDALYGASRMILEKEYSRFGVTGSFVDTSDATNVEKAMRPETKLVYLESPANPTLKLCDIAAISEIAHRRGALVAVDNTFASPLLQQPFSLGADVVVHSMTKFINGHTDVVAGIVVAKDPQLFARLRAVHVNVGPTMDPHQAWLVFRGVKTLGLRMEKAQANALEVARFLEAHPKVSWVRYPFLPSHPQYDLARRQMSGGGAIVSFGVKGGLEAGRTLMNSVKLATLAVSLGGLETLIEHPASMTHASVPRAEREKAEITDDLVRIAVGCEDAADLCEDLGQALAKA
jgi:methionine-gamma-lyase